MHNKTIAVFGIGLSLCLGLGILPASAQTGAPIQAEPHDYVLELVQEELPAGKPQLELSVRDSGEPQIDRTYQELRGDLDGDGHVERVALIPFQITENETFMCLVVFSDKNKVIWRSPRLTDPTNKETFGLYHYGCCDLQLLCDLDKDGYMELIGSMPRSDVRPAPYRVWKWDGKKFVYQFRGFLEGDKNDKELFHWQTKAWDGLSDVRWLDNLQKENGQIRADVISYKDSTPISIGSGSAYFSVTNDRGFRVKKWIKPVSEFK